MPVIFDQVIGTVDKPPATQPEATPENMPPPQASRQKLMAMLRERDKRIRRLSAD